MTARQQSLSAKIPRYAALFFPKDKSTGIIPTTNIQTESFQTKDTVTCMWDGEIVTAEIIEMSNSYATLNGAIDEFELPAESDETPEVSTTNRPKTKPAKKTSKKQTADLFGVSMIVPLLPTHARALGASPVVAGALGSSFGAMQLFTGPLVGQWSDVAGRRFTLLVCLIMSACGYTMCAFATTVMFMFVARIPLGIFKHSQTISRSYVADITNKNDQVRKMGHFNAVSSIGFILGPPVGGLIAELKGGFYLVSVLTAVIFFANSVLVWFFVQEPSLKKEQLERNDISSSSSSSSSSSFKQEQSEETSVRSKGFLQAVKQINWPNLWDLFVIKFLLSASVIIFGSNMSLMLQERYNTSPSMNGYVISVIGVASALVGFITGYIARLYNNNAKLLLHLTVLQVISLVCASLQTPLWIFVMFMLPLGFISTVERVTSTSLTLERGTKDEVGILMGFQQSCNSVARVIGPVVAGIAQEVTLSGPGIVGAVISLVAVIIMFVRPQDPEKRAKDNIKKKQQ